MKNGMYESLDGLIKERNNSWSHMLQTQIPFIQGFGASKFHIWYWDFGSKLEKLSLEDFWKGHDDTYDVASHSTLLKKNLSYFVGWIRRTPHKCFCS